jgi:hypothetical protein
MALLLLLFLLPDSATRLLIDFAIMIKYCYSFLTRLVERAREVLKMTLPSIVFDILCHVTSAIFKHLVKIQWKSVLKEVGGWVGAYFLWLDSLANL